MTSIRIAAALASAFLLGGCASLAGHRPDAGLVAVKSPHGPAETMSRLEAQVRQRGLAVVARVDHAGAAARTGQALRLTEVIVFGNPEAGTPLMQCAQTAGIDLPLKALVWVDAASQTWVGYNDPGWIVQRHHGGDCPAVAGVRKALAGLVDAAVAK